MDVKNTAEKRIYDKQKFYYIITEFGQSTMTNVGAGGTVSSGTNYGTAGGQMTYFYKIYSCAVGGDNNQKAMLELWYQLHHENFFKTIILIITLLVSKTAYSYCNLEIVKIGSSIKALTNKTKLIQDVKIFNNEPFMHSIQ